MNEARRTGRLRGWEAAASGRVARSRSQLEEARATNVWVERAFDAVERDTRFGGGILAGALAFRVFMFLIPYAYLVVSTAGIASTASGTDPRTLARKVGIAGLAAEAITETTTTSTTTQVLTYAVAAFVLLWASRTVLKTLRAVHGLIWQVPVTRMKRPTVAALIFIVITTVAVGLVRLIAELREISLPLGLVASALFVLVPATAWLFVSERAMPHPEESTRLALWPGALVVGVGTQLLHLLTVYWVVHLFESKSATYGAIGTSVALLSWAYALGRLLTASAVVNASLWYRHHPHPGAGMPSSPDSPSSKPATTSAAEP